jgi:glycosyltransferase involved in cell wall biosynthesis
MNPEVKNVIWIVFLGKQGGGVPLLRETELVLSESRYSVLSIVSKIENSILPNSIEIRTPHKSVKGLIHFVTFPLCTFILFFRSRRSLPLALVQIMPSPMDYWLDLWCAVFKIPVYRAIHDFAPHPGELWPTRGALKRRLKLATTLFVFSNFVASNLDVWRAKGISKCQLPAENYPEGGIDLALEKIVHDLSSPLVLFIGRFREYKGLSFLLDALMDSPELKCSFLLAGSGQIDIGMSKKVSVWNHWLSESEIDFLLTSADIVIFPYIEASQSGMLSLAKGKGRIILATKVGALEEQLEGYDDKILVKTLDLVGLVQGLVDCIKLYEHRVDFKDVGVSDNPKSLGRNVIARLTNNF